MTANRRSGITTTFGILSMVYPVDLHTNALGCDHRTDTEVRGTGYFVRNSFLRRIGDVQQTSSLWIYEFS